MEVSDVITALGLTPLDIEGGFFNELYRSGHEIVLNGRTRCLGTSIYYLLDGSSKSDWHRVENDEIWYYHAGSPAVQLVLFPDGSWKEVIIGPDLMAGQLPQSVIPAGTWQAAVLLDSSDKSWGLFGASVFPGFEYADFELGQGNNLALEFESARSRMADLGLL